MNIEDMFYRKKSVWKKSMDGILGATIEAFLWSIVFGELILIVWGGR